MADLAEVLSGLLESSPCHGFLHLARVLVELRDRLAGLLQGELITADRDGGLPLFHAVIAG